jgi:hypothetical protein
VGEATSETGTFPACRLQAARMIMNIHPKNEAIDIFLNMEFAITRVRAKNRTYPLYGKNYDSVSVIIQKRRLPRPPKNGGLAHQCNLNAEQLRQGPIDAR